ncbi:deaminase [Xylanimonas allomyrinae]|uniref:Deaminase n=1 Tax=Xylanimonas allomyrinae TaxID=2509459 RepID=A0A4P6EJS2_9MICO|nr:dihydrofolate reductase family protein [Xylanimonas allomyrinae]QAY62822.1 deaminase [Xylanimonas allomyrinae]
MSSPALNLLVPEARTLPPDAGEATLARLYAHAPGVVRATMIATVDGGAWGPDHVSGSINDDADWRVFRVLRALADVVVVGAGTARAERYTQLGRPRGLGHLRADSLELAVVTRSGDVPQTLLEGDRPPLVITGAHGAQAALAAVPPERVIVAPVPPGGDGADGGGASAGTPPHDVDLGAGLAALTARGLSRVLCEGGPHLLADLLAAGLVDELCLTTAALLVGPGPDRIVAGGPPGAGPPSPARLAHLLHAPDAGTMLARWLLRAPRARAGRPQAR